jgi:hypothetical protein
MSTENHYKYICDVKRVLSMLLAGAQIDSFTDYKNLTYISLITLTSTHPLTIIFRVTSVTFLAILSTTFLVAKTLNILLERRRNA